MSVISLTYSTCMVHNVSDMSMRTSDFSYTKAIAHGQSENSSFLSSSFT